MCSCNNAIKRIQDEIEKAISEGDIVKAEGLKYALEVCQEKDEKIDKTIKNEMQK